VQPHFFSETHREIAHEAGKTSPQRRHRLHAEAAQGVHLSLGQRAKFRVAAGVQERGEVAGLALQALQGARLDAQRVREDLPSGQPRLRVEDVEQLGLGEPGPRHEDLAEPPSVPRDLLPDGGRHVGRSHPPGLDEEVADALGEGRRGVLVLGAQRLQHVLGIDDAALHEDLSQLAAIPGMLGLHGRCDLRLGHPAGPEEEVAQALRQHVLLGLHGGRRRRRRDAHHRLHGTRGEGEEGGLVVDRRPVGGCLGHRDQLALQHAVIEVSLGSGGLDGGQDLAQRVHQREQPVDNPAGDRRFAVAQPREQGFAGVCEALQTGKFQEAAGALHGVDRAEDSGDEGAVVELFLQRDEVSVELEEILVALDEEVADYLVMRAQGYFLPRNLPSRPPDFFPRWPRFSNNGASFWRSSSGGNGLQT